MAPVKIEQANKYFNARLNADPWFLSSDYEKPKALAQAERTLELYRSRVSATRFFYAVCEQALWYLQDDSRGKLQRGGVKGFSLGSLTEQFETGGRDMAIAPEAWAYLRHNVGVKLGRII